MRGLFTPPKAYAVKILDAFGNGIVVDVVCPWCGSTHRHGWEDSDRRREGTTDLRRAPCNGLQYLVVIRRTRVYRSVYEDGRIGLEAETL